MVPLFRCSQFYRTTLHVENLSDYAARCVKMWSWPSIQTWQVRSENVLAVLRPNHSNAVIEPYHTPKDSRFYASTLFYVLDYCVSPVHLQWMYFLRDFGHYHCWSKTYIPHITSCVQPTKLQALNRSQTALAEFSQPARYMFTKTS